MSHVNQITIGPHIHLQSNKTAAEIIADNPVGKIGTRSGVPYLCRITESNAIPQKGGRFLVSLTVEPVSGEEMEQYYHWTYHDPQSRAKQIAAVLRQKSWYGGTSRNATIFCDTCLRSRPAHGANHYADSLICNVCVEWIEDALAHREIGNPQQWIANAVKISKIHHFIDEAEKLGKEWYQIGVREYLEVRVLYQFIRHSMEEAVVEDWYPYPDMLPCRYEGLLRRDWEPGEDINAPPLIVLFPNRNNLFRFLLTGELPAQGEEET